MTTLLVLFLLIDLALFINWLSIKSNEYSSIQRFVEYPDYDFEGPWQGFKNEKGDVIYFYTVLFNGVDVSDKVSAATGRTGNPFSTKMQSVTWLDSGMTENGKVRILKTGRFR
jgi:hypothetical protein